MEANEVRFPTLQAQCHDAERRSLAKINELLFGYLFGFNGSGTPVPPNGGSLQDLIEAIQEKDTILVTSKAWVTHFVCFNTSIQLWQLDAFSINPALRWIMLLDSDHVDLTKFPLYIAPIYPMSSTSFMLSAPFSTGLTAVVSTAANAVVEDTTASVLITAIGR